MAKPTKSMTTSQFAKAAGIPAATVSKLIREGKLKAKKEGKSWMIPPSQLEAKIVRDSKKGPKPSTSKKPSKSAPSPKPSKASAGIMTAPAPPLPSAPAPVAAETPAAVPKPAPAIQDQPVEKTMTIAEFAALTYLTEKGVAEWLKLGRLQGTLKENGEWAVYESNLREPDIARLVRK
jgi:excisionase family DNA binding protein